MQHRLVLFKLRKGGEVGMTEQEKWEKVIRDVISAFDDWENNRHCPGDDWSDVHQSRDMVIALLKAQETVEARLNLCESCAKEFAECETGKDDLAFGSGVGNDNVIGCLRYTNLWKAQEPVEPTIGRAVEHDGHDSWWYQCGKCEKPIDWQDNYCRHCGQAVKWDG